VSFYISNRIISKVKQVSIDLQITQIFFLMVCFGDLQVPSAVPRFTHLTSRLRLAASKKGISSLEHKTNKGNLSASFVEGENF
jgi:hypothetical protein